VGLREADLKAELTLRNAKLGVNGSSIYKMGENRFLEIF
jgi:hypothetical protein